MANVWIVFGFHLFSICMEMQMYASVILCFRCLCCEKELRVKGFLILFQSTLQSHFKFNLESEPFASLL